MAILHDSNSYSDSGEIEITVPVALKLFVYPEIQVQEEKKQSVGYSPIQKPISESSVTVDDERIFVYEVIGLRSHVCRTSRFFLTVPYSRMNQEMQRLTRQGGHIVSVRPKI